MTGTTQVINDGLDLEYTQYAFGFIHSPSIYSIRFRANVRLLAANESPTATEIKSLKDARQKLRRQLDDWRPAQLSLFPSLSSEIKTTSGLMPENEILLLPSSFSEESRKELGLAEAAKIEYDLREGRAHDALEELRTAIKVFNVNLDFKKTQVFGYGPNTRAQKLLQELQSDKVSSAATYRMAREGLLALGLREDDEILRELKEDQLWGKDTSRLAGLGDSRKEDPWFWHVGRPSGLNAEEQKEWSLECAYYISWH